MKPQTASRKLLITRTNLRQLTPTELTGLNGGTIPVPDTSSQSHPPTEKIEFTGPVADGVVAPNVVC